MPYMSPASTLARLLNQRAHTNQTITRLDYDPLETSTLPLPRLVPPRPARPGQPHVHRTHVQCPVQPAGGSTRYVFTADRPGTFFWHSHVGLQMDLGPVGALVVRDPDDPHRCVATTVPMAPWDGAHCTGHGHASPPVRIDL